MYRKIFVPLTGTDSDRRSLGLAGPIAKRFRTNVEAMHVVAKPVVPALFGAEVATPDIAQALYEDTQKLVAESRQRARRTFAEWCDAEGLKEVPPGQAEGPASASWVDAVHTEEIDLAKRARYADLVCFAAPTDKDSEIDGGELAEAVLFQAGRPLLYASQATPDRAIDVIGKTALVGWNGKPEAVHAATAALPLLAASSRVTAITTRVGGLNPEMAKDLAEWLCLHDVPAQAAELAPDEVDTDDMMWIANQRSIGLIVMGAYSHSRLTQMVLGGATRDILSMAPIPTLLMH